MVAWQHTTADILRQPGIRFANMYHFLHGRGHNKVVDIALPQGAPSDLTVTHRRARRLPDHMALTAVSSRRLRR